MNIEKKLSNLGLVLPAPSVPPGAFVASQTIGHQVTISGQVPIKDSSVLMTGHLGIDVSIEEGQLCARWALLNALAHLKKAAGGFDNVEAFIRLGGYVAASPDFIKHPAVIDGASQLLSELFGDKGKHARIAIGVSSLPRGVPVEIELSALLKAKA